MYTETRTDMGPSLAERYMNLKVRIAQAAQRAGRSPEAILVVAVSKYADMDQVRELIRLGHQDFGESRAQQLVQRAVMIQEMLDRPRILPSIEGSFDPDSSMPPPPLPTDVRWHMIGHLQRNKARKILGMVRLIHSVDSLRLVEEIQQIAHKRDETVDVLLQVNCSEEPQKFGCAVPAAAHLAEQIDTMVHLRVRGLMAMAPYSENPEDSKPTFERCREVYDDIRRRGIGGADFNILSMGMSNDFEVAIEYGANMVRIGSVLFGDKPELDGVEDDDDEE